MLTHEQLEETFTQAFPAQQANALLELVRMSYQEVLRVVVAMNVHPTAAEAGAETGVLVVPYSRINRERS